MKKNFVSSKLNRVMLVVFFLVFVLNVLTPYISDDFLYSLKNGFLDIFHKEYIQYMTWTGRSIAHIIDRIFLSLPKIVFDIANSACFVYLTYLVYIHANGNTHKENLVVYGILTGLIFLAVPFFGQTVLWETGACNYLWMTVLILQFLKVYRFQTISPLWMFLFGIVAGWTNENTAGALILLLIFFVVFDKSYRNVGHYAGIVGACIGFVIMIVAPGNAVRSADFVQTNGHLYALIHSFMGALDVFTQGQIILFLLYAVLFGWCLYQKQSLHSTWISLAYVLVGIAAVLAMIASPVPVLYDRSMFGSTILIIVGIGMLLNEIIDEKQLQPMFVGGLSILLVLSCFTYVRALPDLFYTKYLDMKREAYIKTQKTLGNLNPIVPQIHHEFETTYNPIYGLSDLSIYRRQWMNESYSALNGLESIQSTPMEKFNTIYKNADSQLLNITDYTTYVSELSGRKNTIVLVVSNRLDVRPYSDYLWQLSILNAEYTSNSVFTYICGVIENGMVSDNFYSLDPVDKEFDLQGHYCYMASDMDPVHCDIVIDGVEYTNDNAGITFVVFDAEKDCVVDSITFYPDSDQGGIRYYKEK